MGSIFLNEYGGVLLTSTLGRPEWRRWLSSAMECPPGTASRWFNVGVGEEGEREKKGAHHFSLTTWGASFKYVWNHCPCHGFGELLKIKNSPRISRAHQSLARFLLAFFRGELVREENISWRPEDKLFLYFPSPKNLRHFCKASCLPAP